MTLFRRGELRSSLDVGEKFAPMSDCVGVICLVSGLSDIEVTKPKLGLKKMVRQISCINCERYSLMNRMKANYNECSSKHSLVSL